MSTVPTGTQMIALALIDPPLFPMRTSFDDGETQQTKASMVTHGLIHPIVVYRDGERFRVVSGHRRSECAKQLGWAEIECKIVSADDGILESLKIDENIRREKVNPADEAEHLHFVYEHLFASDIEALCAKLNLTFSYASERLNLLGGDPNVLEALRAKRIGIGVAKELNKIKSNEGRFAALDTCVRYGSTESAARQIRIDKNSQWERDQAVANGAPMPDPVPTSGQSHGPMCVCCESPKDPHELQLLYVHSYCLKANLQPLLDRVNGKA